MKELFGHLKNHDLNSIIQHLGGKKDVLKFLNMDFPFKPSDRRWISYKGIILFSVVSEGKTKEEFVEHFASTNFHCELSQKDIILSSNFESTKEVVKKMVVLPGKLLNDYQRTTHNIRMIADYLELKTPEMETTCLSLDEFCYYDIKEMGFGGLVMMHKPAKPHSFSSSLEFLTADANWHGFSVEPSYTTSHSSKGWPSPYGFVFEVPS